MAITILEEVHKSDIGTTIIITVKDGAAIVDISSATTKNIKIKKPVSSTVLTKTGTFTTDGTDGKLQYTTIAGDLDEVGVYNVQAYLVLPAGTWNSSIEDMSVFDNVD